MKILYTLLLLPFLSCTNHNNYDGVIISGKIISPKSDMVYLNEVNHFDNLSENYTIDSASVSEYGEFIFRKHKLQSKLVTIGTSNFKPYTYQIYSTAPETYFAGNCEKFFTSIPTFYITSEKSIHINWLHKSEGIDSISSPDSSAMSQIRLREFYLRSKRTNASRVDYDNKVDFNENWAQMLIEKDYDLQKASLENINIENSFDNYLYTEIYLGHLNLYLNWFEKYYPEKIKASLDKSELNSFYSNIFSEYKEHQWNSKSLEYYKFTERYVNHHMNLEAKTFEQFYKPSQKKRKLAKKVLEGNNRKRYLSLIDEQMEYDFKIGYK